MSNEPPHDAANRPRSLDNYAKLCLHEPGSERNRPSGRGSATGVLQLGGVWLETSPPKARRG